MTENNDCTDLTLFQRYVELEILCRLSVVATNPGYCHEVFILSKLNTLQFFLISLFKEREIIIFSDPNTSHQNMILLNYCKMDIVSNMIKECYKAIDEIVSERYEIIRNNAIHDRLTVLENRFNSLKPFDPLDRT